MRAMGVPHWQRFDAIADILAAAARACVAWLRRGGSAFLGCLAFLGLLGFPGLRLVPIPGAAQAFFKIHAGNVAEHLPGERYVCLGIADVAGARRIVFSFGRL